MGVRPDSGADWQEENTVRRDRHGSAIGTWIYWDHELGTTFPSWLLIHLLFLEIQLGLMKYILKGIQEACAEKKHML